MITVCSTLHTVSLLISWLQMGLGKTIQTIALLASVQHEDHDGRPALVVVPLSTLRNWEREFAAWAPQMNVVTLVGTVEARKVRARTCVVVCELSCRLYYIIGTLVHE